MKQKLLHFSTLLLLMLVTGLFWGTWFSLSRTMETFSVAEFIHIGKTIISNVANPMKIILPLCILFMAFSVWGYPSKTSLNFYFIITAFVLLIITLIITICIEVPIDNQIKTWTAETAPTDWQRIRNYWESFHTFRTFTAFGSFACFSGSLLLTDRK